MRPVRAVGVVVALVVAMMVTVFTGMASAAVKGDVTNSVLGNLVFHASGTVAKGSGGFAVFNSTEYGYFSGKVDCYYQSPDTTRAAFVATITKPKSNPPETVTFWLLDGKSAGDQFVYTDGGTCSNLSGEPSEPLQPASGDLSIR